MARISKCQINQFTLNLLNYFTIFPNILTLAKIYCFQNNFNYFFVIDLKQMSKLYFQEIFNYSPFPFILKLAASYLDLFKNT